MLDIKQTNIILYCDHWTETVTFYRDILQLPIHTTFDWFVEFQLTPDSFLSVADQSRTTINSANGQGITITLQVPDIDAAYAHFDTSNVKRTDIKHRWNARVFYIHDPEGNRLELWQPDDL